MKRFDRLQVEVASLREHKNLSKQVTNDLEHMLSNLNKLVKLNIGPRLTEAIKNIDGIDTALGGANEEIKDLTESLKILYNKFHEIEGAAGNCSLSYAIQDFHKRIANLENSKIFFYNGNDSKQAEARLHRKSEIINQVLSYEYDNKILNDKARELHRVWASGADCWDLMSHQGKDNWLKLAAKVLNEHCVCISSMKKIREILSAWNTNNQTTVELVQAARDAVTHYCNRAKGLEISRNSKEKVVNKLYVILDQIDKAIGAADPCSLSGKIARILNDNGDPGTMHQDQAKIIRKYRQALLDINRTLTSPDQRAIIKAVLGD